MDGNGFHEKDLPDMVTALSVELGKVSPATCRNKSKKDDLVTLMLLLLLLVCVSYRRGTIPPALCIGLACVTDNNWLFSPEH